MRPLFRILLLLLFPLSNSLGQSYNFLHFTVEDGLSNSTVLDICEDKFGHLWFATQGGGLNKYNGSTFERITIRDGLASNYVRNILSDKEGNIWAATASGISMYDGNEIKNYLHVEQEVNSVNVIHEGKDGEIWFSNPSGGVGNIKNDSITVFTEKEGFVNDIVIDIKSNESGLWILTNIHGLFRYSNNKFEHVLSNMDFKGWLLSMELRSDGTFLIGTNKGILLYNPEYKDNYGQLVPALVNHFVRSLTLDAEENIWVALSNGAVKLGDNSIMNFSEKEGFTSNSINVIFKDREGTLWFGTEGDGLYKFSGELFFKLDESHGLNGSAITTVVEDKNKNLWIGTYGGGFDIYNGDSVVNILSDQLQSSYITSSCRDKDGNLWFGTRDGVLKYDYDKFYHYTSEHGLINNVIKCISADEAGNIWIGTVNGLSIFNGDYFINFKEEDGLSGNIIWQLLPTPAGSFYVVTRGGIERLKDGKLETVTRDEEVFKKRLNAVLFDEAGNLWIGYSGHGISRIESGTNKITSITTSEGLSSDFIYNLIWDNEGNLIVGTERGIDKLFLDKNNQLTYIKSYSTIEGFKGIKTSAQALYKQPDGSIWFGSDNGLFKYQPQFAKINEVTPLTYISRIKLFYNDINWAEEGYEVSAWNHLPENLELDHDKNHIIFHYNGISLKNPQEVKYQFMLDNLENRWSPPTTKVEAAYTNLPPGEYTFKVRAANSDGVWSTDHASFKFMINSPFWRQWWFYILIVLIGLALLKFINDYRVKRQVEKLLMLEKVRAEEQHNVRKKMARDFHDNMGNQLASITVYVNLISMKLKNRTADIDDLLTNIEKHTKSLFTGTKDFIWSMDPQSDEVHELFTYIKDFGEELFQNTSHHFYSKISTEMPKHINLPSGYSRQIVLIFKEAMTNVLKHSNGDKVHFYLHQEDSYYVFSLRDNGEGLTHQNERKSGKGLRNMESRAAQIGADIVTRNNGGMEIILKIHSKNTY